MAHTRAHTHHMHTHNTAIALPAPKVVGKNRKRPQSIIITFRVRRSRGEMYIGHGRLCVWLYVCPSSHSNTATGTRI